MFTAGLDSDGQIIFLAAVAASVKKVTQTLVLLDIVRSSLSGKKNLQSSYWNIFTGDECRCARKGWTSAQVEDLIRT